MDLVRLGKEYNEAANLTGFFNEDEEIREEMIYNRMAEHLEKCAEDKNRAEIEEKTPQLLELYRSYINKLSDVVGGTDDDAEKEVIPESELNEAFAAIKEFVSGSYFDSADDIMNMLSEYRIPDEYIEKYEKVKRLMAAVDRDGLLNIL